MKKEQILLEALKKIFDQGDRISANIAAIALNDYRLQEQADSFEDFRGSTFLESICKSNVRNLSGLEAQKLFWHWHRQVPYRLDQKPSNLKDRTDQEIADWFLSDFIGSQGSSSTHYRTKVQGIYDYAHRMTLPTCHIFDRGL